MKRLLILVVVGFLYSLTTAAFAGNNGKQNSKPSDHSKPSDFHFNSEHCDKDHCEKDYCKKDYCYPCDKMHCDKYWRETNYCFHDCSCDSYYDCFYDSSFDCYCYYDCNHVCHHCERSMCCDRGCHESKPPFVNTIHPIIYHGPTTPVNTIHPIASPIVHSPNKSN